MEKLWEVVGYRICITGGEGLPAPEQKAEIVFIAGLDGWTHKEQCRAKVRSLVTGTVCPCQTVLEEDTDAFNDSVLPSGARICCN